MKNKIILLTLFLFIAIDFVNAQKVTVKKDQILVDGVAVLNCKTKDFGTEFSIYELNTTNEIIFSKDQSGFNYLLFVKQDVKMKSKNFFNSIREFAKWLFENGVIDTNGKINEEKTKLFVKKYNIKDN